MTYQDIAAVLPFGKIRFSAWVPPILALAALLQLFGGASLYAQANSGCDHGIVRSGNGVNGDVTICSAIAAQVPALAKQLSEIGKQVSQQSSQKADLDRLVRAVNSLSRSLGETRQTELLEHISSKLGAGTGTTHLASRLTILADDFDSAQDQVESVLSNPATAARGANALQGSVGDAITRLDFTTVHDQLDGINTQLKEINSKLDNVDRNVTNVSSQVGDLNDTLNPLSKASPEAKRILYESQSAQTACTNLQASWTVKQQRTATALQAQTMDNQRALLAGTNPAAAANESDYERKFQTTIAPSLTMLVSHLRRVVPPGTPYPDVQGVKGFRDLMQVQESVGSLYQSYLVECHVQGRGLDPGIVREYMTTSQTSHAFLQEWIKSGRSAAMANLMSVYQRVNQQSQLGTSPDPENAAIYRSTVAPHLTQYKALMTKHLHEQPPPADYADVNTLQQLIDVCSNFQLVMGAYRDAVYRSLHVQ